MSEEPTATETESEPVSVPTLVGLDLGTNSSCLIAEAKGSDKVLLSEIVPTVVGYAKDGLLPGILPDDRTTLFGNEALKFRLHLNMIRPLKRGVIGDLKTATDFMRHLRTRIPVPAGAEIRAVIGVPARADETAREQVREAVRGVFSKILLIPEPFLAALGYRDESKLGLADYIDPVNNSLFIDIGAGSTDLCIVQGYYPQPNDQISIPFAGDAVDASITHLVSQKYPDCDLSEHRICEIKETHSYVGELAAPIVAPVVIGGKPRKLDVGQEIGSATRELLDLIFEAVKQELALANPDGVPELLQNIVITGGGSQIRNIAPFLQGMLEEEGYDQPRVRIIGADYKEFVAKGAMKAARAVKERQWQNIID
jgi:rod shape-determining protein MreB and related proteins